LFGWTLNFANPLSYIIMIAFVLVILFLKLPHIKTNYPFG